MDGANNPTPNSALLSHPGSYSTPHSTFPDQTNETASQLSRSESTGDLLHLSHAMREPDWEWPGWGTVEFLDAEVDPTMKNVNLDAPHHLLGEWSSTAICGNDITSSCFYVVGSCAADAGIFAPVSLLIVAFLLYCFRSVYAEVGETLPLNGGSYTLLLNVAPKLFAALGACLTLLSYVATAVVSATSAMQYLKAIWPGLPVVIAVIVLLGLFALLNLMGVTESAIVAFLIFATHLICLLLLNIFCVIYVIRDSSVFWHNIHFAQFHMGNPAKHIFFGFASAMLGVSGFESSANFIEQQKPGVFPKTLRNMWIITSMINPITSVTAMCVLELETIQKGPYDLLATMGLVAGGKWLQWLIAIDATLVLSGAVLTSYVGVVGLGRRLALDRCLPQFLLAKNKLRHTNHWIIIGFFIVCSSLFLILNGNISSLESVYALCFLSVMSLFAVGNMALKYKRSSMPRDIQARWLTVFVSFCGVVLALAVIIFKNPAEVWITLAYYAVTVLIVGAMFARIALLKMTIYGIRYFAKTRIKRLESFVEDKLKDNIIAIHKQAFVFFSADDNLALLNRAILYVRENEQTYVLKIVHCFDQESEVPPKFLEHRAILDEMYPHIRIDFLGVKGQFGPQMVEFLSQKLDIPKNLMFISAPGGRFPYTISALGGVRIITTNKSRKFKLQLPPSDLDLAPKFFPAPFYKLADV